MNIYTDEAAMAIATQLVNAITYGRRESTYKQCFGLALTIECSADPTQRTVSLLDLADRFIDLYWQALEPFDGITLHQVKRGQSSLLTPILKLKSMSGQIGGWKPGRKRKGRQYFQARRTVAQRIAQMPATHIQSEGEYSAQRVDFLYDSSWLHKKITQSELNDHGWEISLFQGVGQSLAASSSLLVPLLQAIWLQDIAKLNEDLQETRRLTNHLFGNKRQSLQEVREPLQSLQDSRCFYCGLHLGPSAQVDHVVPWSRSGLDDLSNLVVVDQSCNFAKSDLLPDPKVLDVATRRPHLERIANELNWEDNPERVRATGIAMLEASNESSLVWGMNSLIHPRGSVNEIRHSH